MKLFNQPCLYKMPRNNRKRQGTNRGEKNYQRLLSTNVNAPHVQHNVSSNTNAFESSSTVVWMKDKQWARNAIKSTNDQHPHPDQFHIRHLCLKEVKVAPTTISTLFVANIRFRATRSAQRPMAPTITLLFLTFLY